MYKRSVCAGESFSHRGGNGGESAYCSGKRGYSSANEELYKRVAIVGANADLQKRTVVREDRAADSAHRAMILGQAASGGRKALDAAGRRDRNNSISRSDGIQGGGKKEKKSFGAVVRDEQEGETLPENDSKQPKPAARLHLQHVENRSARYGRMQIITIHCKDWLRIGSGSDEI